MTTATPAKFTQSHHMNGFHCDSHSEFPVKSSAQARTWGLQVRATAIESRWERPSSRACSGGGLGYRWV